MSPDSKWENIQNDINTCPCRTDTLFVQTTSIPVRPPSSFTGNPLLLISEAPPETGGFWNLSGDDSLRSNVLQLLRTKGLQIPANSKEALDSFIAGGLFLVQTLKWPLANRKTYNNLGPAQKRQLTEHAAARHLQSEMMALAPNGIYAMGNAAWDACRRLSVGAGLPEGGVETVRGMKDLFINLSHRKIPINVSILPTAYNFNTRFPMVLDDFTDFLNRHSWQPSKPASQTADLQS